MESDDSDYGFLSCKEDEDDCTAQTVAGRPVTESKPQQQQQPHRPAWLSQAIASCRGSGRSRPSSGTATVDLSFIDRARLSSAAGRSATHSHTLPPPNTNCTPSLRFNTRLKHVHHNNKFADPASSLGATNTPSNRVKNTPAPIAICNALPDVSSAATAPEMRPRKATARLAPALPSRNPEKPNGEQVSRVPPRRRAVAIPVATSTAPVTRTTVSRKNRVNVKNATDWSAEEHRLLKEAIASGSLKDLQHGSRFWETVSVMVGRPAVECAREAVRMEETRLENKRGGMSKSGRHGTSLEELRAKVPEKGNSRQWRVQQFMEKAAFHRDAPQDLLRVDAEQGPAEQSHPHRRSSATPLWNSSAIEQLQSFKTGLTPRPSLATSTGAAAPAGLGALDVDCLVSKLNELENADPAEGGNRSSICGIAVPDLVAPGHAGTRSLALQRFADRHRRKVEETRKVAGGRQHRRLRPIGTLKGVEKVIESSMRDKQEKALQDDAQELLWALENCTEPLERSVLQQELNALDLPDDD